MVQGTFSTTTKALYWFHLSAGVPAFTKSFYGMQLTPDDFIGINKANTAYPDDLVTTDALRWLPAGSKISVTTVYNLYNNGPLSQTSWLWLRLDSFITPLVAFHVVLTQSYTVNSVDMPVPFTKVIINEGGGWNSSTYKFSAPITGIYFFSFGGANPNPKYITTVLRLNGQYKAFAGTWENSLRNGLETARAAMLLNVTTADVVYVSMFSVSYPVGNYQCFFLGYRYNPVLFNQIAWSVGRSIGNVYAPADYVQLDMVNVNQGNVWNNSTNSAIISVPGVYIIDLASYLCGSGTSGGGKCNGNENMQLLLNDKPIIDLKLISFTANNCITRSRTVAAQLTLGDEMRVSAPINGSAYISSDSEGRQYILFSGFLINPLN